MDNGPDREVSKVEDLAKATPGMAWKLAKGLLFFGKKSIKKQRQRIAAKKAKRAEDVKYDTVQELLKHDPDGHIRRMLTKNPEFKKYVKPRIKPQSRFKRMTNFRRRKKMDPTQQVNKKPIQYTKADIETRNTFLEELKILDKKGAIEESINRNPKLTQGPMKKVKGRTKGKPAVDRSTISKNESHQRPLNQIMAEGKKKSVQQNAQLLKNKQLNLGRTR